MHSQDTINRFIELRAQRKSHRRIAEALGVCTNTTLKWDAEYQEQIKHVQLLHLEALQEKYLATHEEKLADLTAEIAAINAELKMRDFEDVSTEFLLYRKTCLQSRLDKLAVAPSPIKAASPTEPSTQK